jgi:hydroxymethylpyrimidine pyrophosphatase-like HAD family hydrolase
MHNASVIQLVVTDLDGTLWRGEASVPPSTRDAIHELERRRIPLLAAAARRSWSAAHYFRLAGLDQPVVLLNGALGRERGGGPSSMHAHSTRRARVPHSRSSPATG